MGKWVKSYGAPINGVISPYISLYTYNLDMAPLTVTVVNEGL